LSSSRSIVFDILVVRELIFYGLDIFLVIKLSIKNAEPRYSYNSNKFPGYPLIIPTSYIT